MTKWRSVGALLILGTACATPTNGGLPADDVSYAGGDSSGGDSFASSGSSSLGGGADVSGAPSAGSDTVGAAGAAVGGAASGGAAAGGATAGGASGAAGAHAGAGGTHAGAGGASGATSGGASGASSSGAGGASAGAGGASAGACASPKDVTAGNSGGFGTAGAVCLRTTEKFNTVGCSNFGGRTLKVNGVLATCGAKTTFPPAIGGYNYFDVSAGDLAYASVYWFSS